jgi:hypothetical protein
MNPKDSWWKLDDNWLDDLEVPWTKPKINIEYKEYKPPYERELEQEISDLKKENERLQKELAASHERGRSLAKSCSEAAQEIGRLMAENKQLQQELAEARELSLF